MNIRFFISNEPPYFGTLTNAFTCKQTNFTAYKENGRTFMSYLTLM